MTKANILNRDGAELLLRLLERKKPIVLGSVIAEPNPAVLHALVAQGALKRCGIVKSALVADGNDARFVDLNWDLHRGGYRYFDGADGHIVPNGPDQTRYRVSFEWWLSWLAGQLGLRTDVRPVCLVADRLWDFGSLLLGETKRSARKTAVYFARRINYPDALPQIQEMLRQRSGRPLGVILTTTPPSSTTSMTAIGNRCALVPITACAHGDAERFTIDPAIVKSAAHGARPVSAGSPIQVDADFRFVTVGQRNFRFRGDKQRQVIGALHRKRDEGAARVSTALIFADLEFREGMRLRDLFKGHANWQDLIGHEGGACWLRYDELLAAQGITSD